MSTSRRSDPQLLRELRGEVARLRRRTRRLEAVLAAVQGATIWDFSVYEERPDARWLAIDREDLADLLLAVEGVDSWRPWSATLERRPTLVYVN